MTGAEAEHKLKRHRGNCYLIRYSNSKQHYVLSVLNINAQKLTQEICHFKLNIRKEGDHNVYEIEGTEQEFTDISALLEFYRHDSLTHSNCTIGEVCVRPSL